MELDCASGLPNLDTSMTVSRILSRAGSARDMSALSLALASKRERHCRAFRDGQVAELILIANPLTDDRHRSPPITVGAFPSRSGMRREGHYHYTKQPGISTLVLLTIIRETIFCMCRTFTEVCAGKRAGPLACPPAGPFTSSAFSGLVFF